MLIIYSAVTLGIRVLLPSRAQSNRIIYAFFNYIKKFNHSILRLCLFLESFTSPRCLVLNLCMLLLSSYSSSIPPSIRIMAHLISLSPTLESMLMLLAGLVLVLPRCIFGPLSSYLSHSLQSLFCYDRYIIYGIFPTNMKKQIKKR